MFSLSASEASVASFCKSAAACSTSIWVIDLTFAAVDREVHGQHLRCDSELDRGLIAASEGCRSGVRHLGQNFAV